jgi:hypothetical protein
MDNRNNANQLVEYMEAAIEDDTSNKEEIEIMEDPLQPMWSIFYGPLPVVEIQNQGCALKSGKQFYEHPVASSNPSSQKLVPRALPRKTKHNRKNKRIAALGQNNKIMSNFLIRNPPPPEKSDAMIDPTLSKINLESLDNKNLVGNQLQTVQTNYLSAPTASTPKTDAEKAQLKAEKAKSQWEELNTALNSATAIIKSKSKKDKKIKIPQMTIDNIHKFNTLRYQYTLDGTPLPTSAAALATAQSSIRQHQINKCLRSPSLGFTLQDLFASKLGMSSPTAKSLKTTAAIKKSTSLY